MNLLIEVLEEFTCSYDAELTGSVIAKKKHLNQKTVSSYLKNLEKSNFLKSRTEGKNRLYRINLEDREIAKKFISMIEDLKAIRFYRKNPVIKQAIQSINTKGTVIVFGSYAKGTQKEGSDLDIMIIGEAASIRKAEDTYNIEINAKIFSKKEFDTKSILIREVIKNHVILKESDFFIEETIAK